MTLDLTLSTIEYCSHYDDTQEALAPMCRGYRELSTNISDNAVEGTP